MQLSPSSSSASALSSPAAAAGLSRRLRVPGGGLLALGNPIAVAGRSFTPASNEDFSDTTLLDLTPSGIVERLRVRGEWREVVRLRPAGAPGAVPPALRKGCAGLAQLACACWKRACAASRLLATRRRFP